MPDIDIDFDTETFMIERIKTLEVEIFNTQFRLGCIERLYPGLTENAYQQICQMIVASYQPFGSNTRQGLRYTMKRCRIWLITMFIRQLST